MCCFVFVISIVSAQSKDSVVLYYDANETSIVEPELASVVAFVTLNQKGLYHRKSYYTTSKTLSTEGESYDQFNKQKEGEQIHYYANGNVESVSHFSNGQRNGAFVSYFPEGNMKDSAIYFFNRPIGHYASWHMNGNPEIVANFDTLGNGKGVLVSFFSNGNVAHKGRFDFGFRKVGQWNYYHVNGNKSSILVYPKTNESPYGNTIFMSLDPFENFVYDTTQPLTSITCYDEYGVQSDSNMNVRQVAIFGKDEQAWYNYIFAAIRNKAQYYNVTGYISYDMYFTVNEEGKVVDVQIANKIEPEFDAYVKNAVKTSGKWLPAKLINRSIPTQHNSHVTFSLTRIYH